MNSTRAASFALAGAVTPAGSGHAQTRWYVDDDACPLPGSGTELDPFCSIQYAILASSDGDEIVVMAGTNGESLNLLGRAIWLHSAALEYQPPRCAADITGPAGQSDDNVDALDFLMLISQWGPDTCVGTCAADITGPMPFVPDGSVDSLDFLLLISQWGSPGNCPSS